MDKLHQISPSSTRRAESMALNLIDAVAELGKRDPERVQGVKPGGAMHVQVQDFCGGEGMVGEREVHSGLRLAGAIRDDSLLRLHDEGSDSRTPLLAHKRDRQVQVDQVRSRLGQQTPEEGNTRFAPSKQRLESMVADACTCECRRKPWGRRAVASFWRK